MATFKSEQINEMVAFLKRKGFLSVEDTEIKFKDKYYPYDVFGEYNGKKYGFEVKHRTFDSTTYGDMIIEYVK